MESRTKTFDLTPVQFKVLGFEYSRIDVEYSVDGELWNVTSIYTIFYKGLQLASGTNKRKVEKEAADSIWFKTILSE